MMLEMGGGGGAVGSVFCGGFGGRLSEAGMAADDQR